MANIIVNGGFNGMRKLKSEKVEELVACETLEQFSDVKFVGEGFITKKIAARCAGTGRKIRKFKKPFHRQKAERLNSNSIVADISSYNKRN